MEKSFRTAMFGFNKEDVAKYIFQQSKSFENKIAEKDAALEKSDAALNELKQRLRDFESNGEKIKELQSLLEDFSGAYNGLISAVSEEGNCIDAVESGYQSLEDRCEKLMAFQEKANKFDSLASALSGIFGNGIKSGEDEQVSVPDAIDGVSPIHQAKVNQEDLKKKADLLGEAVVKITSLIEALRS